MMRIRASAAVSKSTCASFLPQHQIHKSTSSSAFAAKEYETWCRGAVSRTAPPPDTAVFDAVMINSSLEPESAAEVERLRHLTGSLRQALEKSGQYRIVDLARDQGPAERRQSHLCLQRVRD
jgi:hypothetical protein